MKPRKRRPTRRQANQKIDETRATLEAGLNVLGNEEADAIIGEPGPGYKELIQAVQANTEMLYSLALSKGLKRNPGTAEMFSKSTVMMLSLVHKAYALGMRRGKSND